jgi:hypothetical protein
MAMDWIAIQYKIREYHQWFFLKRALTPARIEFAKHKDTGEQAKQIDAAIRAISRRERDKEGIFCEDLNARLTELEKDILAIRLDWVWQSSLWILSRADSYKIWPFGSELTEDEFEDLLTNQWQKDGREKYATAQQKIDRLFPNQTHLTRPASMPPSQSEPPPEKPPRPDDDSRR